MLAVPDLLKLYMQPAVVAIAESIETNLLNLYASFSANAPVGAGGVTITEATVDAAETALFAAKVPASANKYLVVDSATYSALRQIPRFSEFNTAGEAGLRALVDGAVGKMKDFYFSTNGLVAGTTVPIPYEDYGGMPFYDAWTQSQFLATYGTAMATITTNTANPASYPNEVAFLPGLIGNFTNAVIGYVRTSQPACRFEVLYPYDVNATTFNQAFNFPVAAWTPSILNMLKTEGFGDTHSAGIWIRPKRGSKGRMGFRRRSGVTWLGLGSRQRRG